MQPSSDSTMRASPRISLKCPSICRLLRVSLKATFSHRRRIGAIRPIRSSSTGTRLRKVVTSPRLSNPSCSLPNCARASGRWVDSETFLQQEQEVDQMSGKLEGKIALVTGGTAGIGFATAQRFVKEGAYVFVTGRRQAELDTAGKLLTGHLTAVRADASNLDDLDKLFAQIKREKGRLDVVYANAGRGI